MATKNKRALHKKRTKQKPATTDSTEDTSFSLWGKQLCKSVPITLLAGLLMLIASALIAYFCKDPNGLIQPLGLASSAIAAFIGGFAALRLHKHHALLCGLLNGSATMAILMLFSLFFTKDAVGYSAWSSALLHTAFLLFSVIGAYVGNAVPQRKTKHRGGSR